MPLDDETLLTQYIKRESLRVAETTLIRERSDVTLLKRMRDAYKNPSFLTLQSEEIEEYLSSHYKKAYSFNSYRKGIKKIFDYCIEKRVLNDNPITFPEKKIPKTLPKALNKDQSKKLIDHVKNISIKWHFIVEILETTGIRRKELVKLTINDFTSTEGRPVLRVRATSQGGGGKGGKERMIPIPQSLVTSFDNYLKEYRISKDPNAWLFPGIRERKGNHMSANAIRNFLARHSKKLGFHVTPHMLRHTFATNHINAGTNTRVLQKLIGHSEITTTERYTDASLAAMRKAQEQGTRLGEQDRLIQELKQRDARIENLEKILGEARRLFKNMEFTIDEMKDQTQ
ncbi:MAG: tyrosine-type recombinase/integrase [Candidatus Hodarchaeota archaeon]